MQKAKNKQIKNLEKDIEKVVELISVEKNLQFLKTKLTNFR